MILLYFTGNMKTNVNLETRVPIQSMHRGIRGEATVSLDLLRSRRRRWLHIQIAWTLRGGHRYMAGHEKLFNSERESIDSGRLLGITS